MKRMIMYQLIAFWGMMLCANNVIGQMFQEWSVQTPSDQNFIFRELAASNSGKDLNVADLFADSVQVFNNDGSSTPVLSYGDSSWASWVGPYGMDMAKDGWIYISVWEDDDADANNDGLPDHALWRCRKDGTKLEFVCYLPEAPRGIKAMGGGSNATVYVAGNYGSVIRCSQTKPGEFIAEVLFTTGVTLNQQDVLPATSEKTIYVSSWTTWTPFDTPITKWDEVGGVWSRDETFSASFLPNGNVPSMIFDHHEDLIYALQIGFSPADNVARVYKINPVSGAEIEYLAVGPGGSNGGGGISLSSPGDVYYSMALGQTNGYNISALGKIIEKNPKAPIADFVADTLVGVTPFTVQFTDLSKGKIDSWLWDFGDGNTSTEQHPKHTYDVEIDPKFTVSLTVTGPGGSDTETKTEYIEVLLPLHVDFEATPVTGRTPLTVEFTSSASLTVTSYEWDFGDGETSAEANPTHTYATAGDYTVKLKASGPWGDDTEKKKGFITVLDCYRKLDVVLHSSSGEYHLEPWDNAIDGDIDGWNGTATIEGSPPWAIFSFADEQAYMIDQIRMLTNTNVGFADRWIRDFRILVSNTGTEPGDFIEVLSATQAGGGWEFFAFGAVEAKYVKLVVDSPYQRYRQLGEIEIWEAQDMPLADELLSTIDAGGEFIADGIDEATITIALKDATGAPISGRDASKFELFATGSNNQFSEVVETAAAGIYRATMTSTTAEEKTVWVVVGCSRIKLNSAGEEATVEFIPLPEELATIEFVRGSAVSYGEGWDNAIDGDTRGWDGTTTTRGTNVFGVFSFAGSALESVLAVRLLTDTKVGYPDRWVRRFEISVSTTTSASDAFTPVFEGEMTGGDWQKFNFVPVEARYVMFSVLEPSDDWRQLGEFEVYVVGAKTPKLADAGMPAAGISASNLPNEFSLSQNYPNPFNPETTIRFYLPEASPVKLAIYDMMGQVVRVLTNGALPAGEHSLSWNATDEAGTRVASGVYLYALEARSFRMQRKLVLIK